MGGLDAQPAQSSLASGHALTLAPTHHAAFRQRRHFGSLDGLRALSVLAVIWHHTLGHQSGLPGLLAHGYHGVTLFFAISGFLIVTLLLREREGRGFIDLRAFYIRRALRIFPLYFAVLILYTALVAALERDSPAGREFFKNLPFFASYTSNWFVTLDGRVIFYFAWSLAAEEQFYLLWPSIERFARPVAVMTLVIVAVASLLWVGPPADQPIPLWYRMATSIPLAICFGVVLAHLLHRQRSYAWLKWVLGWRASSVVCLAVALALLTWNAQSVQTEIAVHLALVLMVGSCVYREDHLLAPLLRWRFMAYLGSISYGMYLLHMLVKNFVGKALSYLGLGDSPYLLFVLAVAATAAAATLSFRYYESFFLKMKATYSTVK